MTSGQIVGKMDTKKVLNAPLERKLQKTGSKVPAVAVPPLKLVVFCVREFAPTR